MSAELNRDNIISTSVGFLKKVIPSIESIYLFGSQATQQADKLSDIDLAYLAYNSIGNVSRWKIQEELAILLDNDVDLIDLNTASLVMQFQVVNKGSRIFTANEQLAEKYEDKVYALYLDHCELRQPIINNIEESGSIYG